MPPATTSVEDGSLPSGSFDITILETGQAYVADNFSFDQDATLVRSKNAQGNPKRQKVIKGFVDGSCDLQLEEDTTPAPDVGHTFVADGDRSGVAEPYMVVKPGRTFASEDAFKCKVAITRCVNPVLTAAGGKTLIELLAGVSYASTVAITAVNFSAYLPPGDVITSAVWAATNLPAGLALNASTGALTGTPTTPAAAVTVTVKCTLANGKIGKRQFALTIT